MLCRLGQEAVQELVQKTADVFKTLKDLQVSKDLDIIASCNNKVPMGPVGRVGICGCQVCNGLSVKIIHSEDLGFTLKCRSLEVQSTSDNIRAMNDWKWLMLDLHSKHFGCIKVNQYP